MHIFLCWNKRFTVFHFCLEAAMFIFRWKVSFEIDVVENTNQHFSALSVFIVVWIFQHFRIWFVGSISLFSFRLLLFFFPSTFYTKFWTPLKVMFDTGKNNRKYLQIILIERPCLYCIRCMQYHHISIFFRSYSASIFILLLLLVLLLL